MLIEICANGIESVIVAQKAGANRVELCSELAVGGTTPSFGTLKTVIKQAQIPVFVLIRPHSGHFVYSSAVFESMLLDIEMAKTIGCSGIVAGVLDSFFNIDFKRTEKLIRAAEPLPFTFNRAFDWARNAEHSMLQLADLGTQRILSSGRKKTAIEGIDNLCRWQDLVSNKLIILPGSGINCSNVANFKAKGFVEIHASAGNLKPLTPNPPFSFNSPALLSDTTIYSSDAAIIKQINENII